jgi:DNA polymerase II
MKTYTGWLFDLYVHPKQGIVLWLVGEDKKPHSFTQSFQITFYAGGFIPRLRQLWKFLKTKPVILSYVQRDDLYEGTKDVVKVSVINPAEYEDLFAEVYEHFPDLLYFDVDIPLISRYAAEFGLFPLVHCKVEVEAGWMISKITPLDTPWELDPQLPDLRVLHLTPDVNPAHIQPKFLCIHYDHFNYRISINDYRALLFRLNSILRQYNPDVILTSYGDTWLFSFLEEISEATHIPFNPNRDLAQTALKKKAISFHNYGRAHHRGEQVHLYGRWHIDEQNCMTFGDYGLMGAIEQARVTGLPVQEMARRSPGAGVAAMQNLSALQRGVLVPYEQQKGEEPKTYDQLVLADRGGLVFEPLPGVFRNVAILDFVSMYPATIVKYNISPETVCVDEPDAWEIPELNIKVSSHEGLIPATLRPLVDKRVKLRKRLKGMPKTHSCYARDKASADGLKWLGVVSNGRLGFANAVFGRINAHEALSFIVRKMVLRAKEIVENHGFTVLHIYVDSLFICKPDATKEEDFQFLLEEIEQETGLPIEVEAVYSWMAFLSSRQNPNLSVPNLFFGLQSNGEYKIRGLALRREDTPLFIAETQAMALQMLAGEQDPRRLSRLFPYVLRMCQARYFALYQHQVPLEDLIATQTLSRELAEYRVPSPVARAANQLQATGKDIHMGQRIQFLYTKTKYGVMAWDVFDINNHNLIDIAKYEELLFRAAYEVFQPLGVPKSVLKNWFYGNVNYLVPPGWLHQRMELPLFANLRHLRVDMP